MLIHGISNIEKYLVYTVKNRKSNSYIIKAATIFTHKKKDARKKSCKVFGLLPKYSSLL